MLSIRRVGLLDIKPVHCSRMLAVLSDLQRLRIIECLSERPCNVGELASYLGKHMVKVSHHLSVLRKAGLVKSHRVGRFIYYELLPGAGVTGSTSYLDLGCCRLEFSKTTKKCCI